MSQPHFRAGRLGVRAGFTILELIVVLVVGSVLSSFALAKINQIMTSSRLKAAMVAVQNDIEGAFVIAQRNRRPIRIVWNASTMQLRVTDRAGTTVFRRTTLGQAYGLRASDVTFSVSPMEIFPNGLADNALTIAFNSNSFVDTIFVSRGGLVRTK